MQELRQYVRMSTVFPVEVEILKETGKLNSSNLLQGFTRDISAGGMCLEIKTFTKETEELLLIPNAKLALTINTTFSKKPIKALARIAWLKKQTELLPVRYLVGVAYTQIDEKAKTHILQHAKHLVWVPRLAGALGILMLVTLVGLFYHDQRLIAQNKLLISSLVQSAERKSNIASNLYQLQKRKTELEESFSKAQKKIASLQLLIASLTAENTVQKNNYEKELERQLARQKTIGLELKNIKEGKELLKTTYNNLQATEMPTSNMALQQMVEWLGSHQNLHTGLVVSFEGDPFLEDWAFTYDQSLACQTYLLFGDQNHARDILAFFESRASKDHDAFFNAYDSVDGHMLEGTVHVGPNVWIGIAALQYEYRVKDGRFLPLARSIGDWLISQQDKEGGLKGGPMVSWYSTEHNLDAYAFLQMLFKQTHEPKYDEASLRVLSWIKKYAYSVKERRMNRGKGDSTIATDTFSWAIAALGPQTLKSINFDAEAIIDFAEQNSEVTVDYEQPNGKVAKAQGFDFAKKEHVGRGGVISTEWTAQMIVTYQILSDYFKSIGSEEKGALYLDKANFYLNELQKLIITSPSRTGQGRGCLPYASADNVDTGHGWRTPKGIRTGSVSATAYGIFAWLGYNPFSLDYKGVNS